MIGQQSAIGGLPQSPAQAHACYAQSTMTMLSWAYAQARGALGMPNNDGVADQIRSSPIDVSNTFIAFRKRDVRERSGSSVSQRRQ